MERFTQRARRVLSLAQEEAERLQHSYIGTEHLLLGLMREEGGVAGRVLRDLGLDPHRVEELVERMTRAGQRTATARLDLSPGTKKVLELAVDEARRMGHHYIGTEHLLLGLVRQSDGIAIDVLRRLNVTHEEVRRQTRRVLQEANIRRKPPEPPATDTTQEPSLGRIIRSPLNYLPSRWRLVLIYAIAETKRLKQVEVGVEHLLFALTCEQTDQTSLILQSAGLAQEKMRELLPQQPTPDYNPDLSPDFSEELRGVFGWATEEAFKQGINHLCTQHLLLGILRQKENAAIDILKQQNIDLEKIEKATRKSLQ